jgi:hypothetical protein
MSPTLRNVLAIIAGFIAGSAVNMTIVSFSGSVIPLPEGVDPTDVESLKENMHLFEAKNFIFPWLAHAMGTLAGAWVCCRIAVSNHLRLALGIGAFFMLGGIINAFMLPAPVGFIILDIALAYLPMAYIGSKLAKG